MLEDTLQGTIAHANHDVHPEARTLFCEVIVCMLRKRVLGATIRINLKSASAKTLNNDMMAALTKPWATDAEPSRHA